MLAVGTDSSSLQKISLPTDFSSRMPTSHFSEHAANRIGLSPERIDLLTSCFRTEQAPIFLNGRNDIAGLRTQHIEVTGPCLGELIFDPRFHPSEAHEIDRQRALFLSLQNALFVYNQGWPFKCFSGSTGRINLDPSKEDQDQLKAASFQYLEKHAAIMGPERDLILARDQDLRAGWLIDSYQRRFSGDVSGSMRFVLGKGRELLGYSQQDYTDAEAIWVEKVLSSIQDARSVKCFPVAVIGGSQLAVALTSHLIKEGYKVVVGAIQSNKVGRQIVVQHHENDGISQSRLNSLSQEISAATQVDISTIGSYTVIFTDQEHDLDRNTRLPKDVKVVCEAAYRSLGLDFVKELESIKDLFFIPSLLASAGSSLCAAIEYSQATLSTTPSPIWDRKERGDNRSKSVNELLGGRLAAAAWSCCRNIENFAGQYSSSFSEAAWIRALSILERRTSPFEW